MNVAAKVIIYNKHGEMLVLRRSETHPRHPHEADMAGGEIEPGETPSQAAAREIREETGLVVAPDELRPAKIWHTPWGTYHLFEATVDEPKVAISWEHESYEWLTKAAFSTLATKDTFMQYIQEWFIAARM